MDDFYRENILDHFRNPRFKGELDNFTHRHREHNPVCGDEIQIDLIVNQDQIVEQAYFTGHGCAISQASASILMENIQGLSLDKVKQLGKENILESLGIDIGPVRLKCALLSLKVLKASAYGINSTELQELEDEDDW